MSDPEPPASDGQPDAPTSRATGVPVAPAHPVSLVAPAAHGQSRARRSMRWSPTAADELGTPITPQERVLIGNVLKGHGRNAADVMVPRVDIVALDVDQPFAEVVKCMVEHGHSRVPVYRETLDDVIGFMHVKDVLGPWPTAAPTKLAPLLRKVLFVAPSVPILDLLVQMRQARTHIAMVVDEFGGIDGLVTIEDLIEEIVGEIEDEHDVRCAASPDRAADGSIIADARIPIEALEEQHGTRLRPAGDQEDGRYAGRAGLHPGRARAETRRDHRPSRRASSSRCSTPIRGGSSGCGCAVCRRRNGARAPPVRDGLPESAALRVPPGARMQTPLCRLAQDVAALAGWRRYGLAFLLGALLAGGVAAGRSDAADLCRLSGAVVARRGQPRALGLGSARLCVWVRLLSRRPLLDRRGAVRRYRAVSGGPLPFAVLGLPAVLAFCAGCGAARHRPRQRAAAAVAARACSAFSPWPGAPPNGAAAMPSRLCRGTSSAMPGRAAFPDRWLCCRAPPGSAFTG